MALHSPIVTAEPPESMADRVARFDWGATPLGAQEDWPAPLRFAIDLCLRASVPTAVYWGPDL
ncbi:MAG TPA: hypothetical protein VF702_01960, partial [Allosphingosinicella sp.]